MAEHCPARSHTERSSRPGPEPSSVDADVYVWRYALLVMHAGKEEDLDYRYSLNWFRLTGNRDSARLIRNQEPRCSSLRITTDYRSASVAGYQLTSGDRAILTVEISRS